MGLVAFSLRRRVTVSMCAVALVLFGIVAFTRLRVSLLPELTYPSITIETRMPGAAPAEVEQLLTRPIEERVGVVAGVQRLVSVSRPGVSAVTIEFGWDRDMDFAAIDVREKLDLVRLPDDVEPPVLQRFDPSADPILRLYLTGEMDLFELREVAEESVEKDLESTEGVAAIEISGGYEDEIEVRVDEGRLALTGLSLTEVLDRLRDHNVDQAGGSIYEEEARYLVRTRNRFASLDDIRATVLVERDGHRVTVADVADVNRTHQERESITRLGGREAVELAVYKEGDANTTSVATAVHGRLDLVRERLPPGAQLVVAADQSTFIEASVREVLLGAALGGIFAVIVLMAFLKDLRGTLIVAVAIPISAVATFFLMYETGTTLNVMSLGGLALGVGMLVDNAIVVLEAIHKRREEGASPAIAAEQGAASVASAVVASTLTTVAVFLPVAFLEGIAAQLFRDMAVTVCFSLVVSLVVSLTLIPMMSSLMASTTAQAPPGRWARWIGSPVWAVRWLTSAVVEVIGVGLQPLSRLFDAGLLRVTERYPIVLHAAIRRPLIVLVAAVVTLGGTLLAVPRLGLDLVPSMSQGEFGFVVELPQGTPLATTDRIIGSAQRVLEGDARVDRFAAVVGKGASSEGATTQGEHVGSISVRMAKGSDTDDESSVIESLRTSLADAGVTQFRLTRPAVFSLRSPIEVEIFAEDIEALRIHADAVRAAISTIPGIVEARSSAEFGNPEIQVRFDRERMTEIGLSVADVAAVVRGKLQGDVSTRFKQGDREVDIRVRALAAGAASPADVRNLIVGRVGSAEIRLDAVAEVVMTTGPSEIHRVSQSRAAVVSADVAGRDMGAVSQDIERTLAGLALPPEVTARVSGQEQEMFRSLRSLLFALALAGFLVYLVMAAQFESLLHPFIVILSLPLGLVGVVWGLLLTGSSVSVISMVGVVMLAGIVVNNAIVLVDAINQRRARGEPRNDAILAAGRDRLRPILMTTATTVLGLIPMALATGAGAELRRALAVAVIGGLSVATVLTLLVIPAVYRLLDRKRFSSEAGDP